MSRPIFYLTVGFAALSPVPGGKPPQRPPRGKRKRLDSLCQAEYHNNEGTPMTVVLSEY